MSAHHIGGIRVTNSYPVTSAITFLDAQQRIEHRTHNFRSLTVNQLINLRAVNRFSCGVWRNGRRTASTRHQWRFHAGAGGTGPPHRGKAPPNLAVLLTHCGQLILREISKFNATRCQNAQNSISAGAPPQTAGGAYSAPPDSLAGLRGPYL